MTRFNKFICSAMIMLTIAISCSDDSDPNPNQPPPPPGGGDVTITSVEGGNMFWGDEMTIKGTGFSSTKAENIVKFTGVFPTQTFCALNYTSEAGGVIEIVSATATQLKIKIPYKETNGTPICGPEQATLEVTVNGKKGTKEGLEFNALPWIGDFNYHYGWFDVPNVTRIGDSVMIEGGMKGYLSRQSSLWKDIKLSIDGSPIESKYRTIGLESGWAFYLPIDTFGETGDCSEEPDGWGAREMQFTLSVGGKSVSRNLYVQNLPSYSAACDDCPSSSEELNPADQNWYVVGKNMWFTEARFSPNQPCGGPIQSALITKGKKFEDEVSFQIPLSILTPGCSYTVLLADACDRTAVIGQFAR